MGGHLILGILALAAQPHEPGEPAPDPVAAAEEQPIIVTGAREGDADDRPTIVTGSRIARPPVLEAGAIASNAPVGGLSATSGVDPLNGENRVIRRTVSQCRSDDPAIGKEAACLLLDAQTALQRGDRQAALTTYRHLNAPGHFAPAERLAGAEQLFALGQSASDPTLREEGLLRMLATGAMPAAAAQSARRSLAALALQRGDTAVAIDRLRAVVAGDAGDAQSFANLAILLRQEGLAGAPESMARAIAIRTAQGGTIPPGWADFAAAAD